MKRPFIVAGLTVLSTVLLCEAAGYYGYGKLALVIAAVISACVGGVYFLSAIPDIGISSGIRRKIAIVSLCIIIGAVSWTIADYRYTNTIVKCLTSENEIYRVADSINVKTSKGYLTTVICSESNAHISLLTTEKIIVYPGDTISADISVTVDQSQKLYNKSLGIHLSGELNGKLKVTQEGGISLSRLLYSLRQKISRNISLHTGDAAGFLKALILGDKSGLSSSEKLSLQRAGVYHICAVSGQHVSIMCMFIGYIIEFLNIKSSKTKFFLTVPVLLLLLGLTGFSVSAIRAVFMSSGALLGKVFLRRTDSLNFLGLILFLILIISPFSAYSASLLLSFMATIGIILFANPLRTGIMTRFFIATGRLLPHGIVFFLGIFTVSVAATVFTAVISEVFFSTLSLCGVLANIVILPIVTAIYIMTVIMILFSFIPYFGSVTLLFSQSVKIGVDIVMTISSWFVDSVFAKADLSFEAIGSCALLALTAAIIYLFKNRKNTKKQKKRNLAYSGAVFAIVFVVSLFGGTAIKSATETDDELYHIAYIDVGQGMSSVVSFGEKAIIIDCGGSKTASSAISDYLYSSGIKQIDAVIISHLHSDHCNAIFALLDEWEIPEIIIPYTEGDPTLYIEILDAADDEGAKLTVLEDDETRRIGNMSLFILTDHLDAQSSDQNENSLVVIADVEGTFRALFSGDITSAAEERLIKCYGNMLDCKVLSVPHHGSKYSSSEAFLEKVSPILSIISVGKNSYGHPTDEAIERLNACGTRLMTTMDYGTIEILTDGSGMEVVYGD